MVLGFCLKPNIGAEIVKRVEIAEGGSIGSGEDESSWVLFQEVILIKVSILTFEKDEEKQNH